MRIHMLYFGEGVGIPKTPFELGVSFISVWINGNGFTSASNDVGTIGYIWINTPDVEFDVDGETESAFSSLHGRVVEFEISPSKFIKDGGVAHIKMTLPVMGNAEAQTIEFTASNCIGVSMTTGSVAFSTEMLQMNRQVTEVVDSISSEEAEAIVANAETFPEEDPSIPV